MCSITHVGISPNTHRSQNTTSNIKFVALSIPKEKFFLPACAIVLFLCFWFLLPTKISYSDMWDLRWTLSVAGFYICHKGDEWGFHVMDQSSTENFDWGQDRAYHVKMSFHIGGQWLIHFTSPHLCSGGKVPQIDIHNIIYSNHNIILKGNTMKQIRWSMKIATVCCRNMYLCTGLIFLSIFPVYY